MPLIVVRAPNWLGDTVMALPALQALRAARAEARIMVIGPWAALLSGQGIADVLLRYPRGLRERLDFARSLRLERADLAVLLPNSLESALAAWGWRARRRLGFDTDGRRPFLTDAMPLPSPRRHQVEEYGLLMSAAGVQVDGDARPVWRLGPDAAADAEVDALLAETGVGAGARIVGLHLGAAFGPSKLWPAGSFGRLAAGLDAARISPVLLGSPDDAETAATVTRAAGAPLPSLVGRDRPALLPRLLARLSCLVSGDTGVAHLAGALGIPTVTLFGPTDPRLTAPRAKTAHVLVGKIACSPCFLTACPIDHICLRGIPPEEVLAQVRVALGA